MVLFIRLVSLVNCSDMICAMLDLNYISLIVFFNVLLSSLNNVAQCSSHLRRKDEELRVRQIICSSPFEMENRILMWKPTLM